MSLIWATRGRDWGFRFLRDGGTEDPLEIYDEVFSRGRSQAEVLVVTDGFTGLRFPDPLGRTDRAGRMIPHEFVLWAGITSEFPTVAAARDFIWPLVADEYDSIWDAPRPPD